MRKTPLVMLSLLVVLAGCETTPTTATGEAETRPQAEAAPRFASNTNALLLEAERSEPERAAELRVEAARRSFSQGELDQAERILALVSDPGTRRDTVYNYYTLGATIALTHNDTTRALQLLDAPRLRALALGNDERIELGILRSDAYRANRSFVASARERIYLSSVLSARDRAVNHEQIFSTLLELPPDILVRQANREVTNDVRGWLSLAALTRQYQDDPVRQLEELNNWRLVWGSHPAAQQLPRSLQTLSRVVSEQPKKIALLLPLQGEFAAAGRAVRDGVLASHYKYSPETSVIVMDTAAGQDVVSLVNEAAAAGAEIVIGPLARDRVAALATRRLPLPVLALNRVEAVNPDLYQFGLAPEDEVLQVIDQIRTDGLESGIIIAPEGAWGDRNIAVFENSWAAELVEIARFNEARDYSDLVKNLLKVDASQERAAELRRQIGVRFEFTPRRRQDIEFIFLLASPPQARSINPALAFFYADDIPVYGTSHLHERSESRIDNIDLNGIRFIDIPWKLTSSSPLQADINATWPNANPGLSRFYALGIDAHRLMPRLQQLSQLPDQRVFGATGVLRIEDGVVYRRLMWGQFSEGSVTTVPIVVQEG